MARRPAAATPALVPGEIGVSGLRESHGYILEEFQKELSGKKGARVYREMSDNDPVVGAVLFAITMLMRNVKWSAQPVDDSQAAEDAAEFVEQVLFKDMETPWDSVMTEIISMMAYGFAPLEIVWKRRGGPYDPSPEGRSAYSDGRIGIRKLALRAQDTIERWLLGEHGEIQGFVQQPWYGVQVTVPADKVLLFRTTAAKNNPEGRSALRNAYRPWYFKKRIEEIEAIGAERDLAGFPVFRVPGRLMDASATAAERALFANFRTTVKNIRRDTTEGLVLPSERDDKGNLHYDFELISSAGQRQFDTTKIVERYSRAIAMTVLADFIFLGQQAVGSFALSSDKTELFSTAIGGWLRSIADTINGALIPKLWRLNALPHELMPRVQHGDIEAPNLGELGSFITALSGAGVPLFPDRALENDLRAMAGLREAPEDASGDDEGAEAMPRQRPGKGGKGEEAGAAGEA